MSFFRGIHLTCQRLGTSAIDTLTKGFYDALQERVLPTYTKGKWETSELFRFMQRIVYEGSSTALAGPDFYKEGACFSLI